MGLPDKIFDGSHEIRYLYDAGGRKLAMSLDGSDTFYRNTLIYNGSGDIPAQVIHPEGFVSTDFGSGFIYNYHKKDHAGNVRVLLTASGLLTVGTLTLLTTPCSCTNTGMCYKVNGMDCIMVYGRRRQAL